MRWLRGLFTSREDFVAYLVLLAVVLCGYLGASLWSTVIIAGALSALTWAKRWSALVSKAHEIDSEYRKLARMVWSADWRHALRLYARSTFVPLVVGWHMPTR